MRSEYAEGYAELYHRHWWWRAREDYLVDVLRRYLPDGRSARILDLGCGAGLFFERLSEFGSVQGVETDTTMRTGRPEIDDRIHWGTLDSFRPRSTFHAVLMLDVLEHLSEPLPFLRQALELLEERGVLIATVPAFPVLWTSHDVLNEHFRRYTRSSLSELLRAAGCRVLTLEYFFHWTFPAKLMVRLAESLGSRRHAAPALPGIPPPRVNRALYRMSRLEQVHLGTWRLPFGSSLLAVATPMAETL
jgi:2-polyprenyl-3-methyl-5-hydroxy-6-metoxy-1,4-benzoquinol methylase